MNKLSGCMKSIYECFSSPTSDKEVKTVKQTTEWKKKAVVYIVGAAIMGGLAYAQVIRVVTAVACATFVLFAEGIRAQYNKREQAKLSEKKIEKIEKKPSDETSKSGETTSTETLGETEKKLDETPEEEEFEIPVEKPKTSAIPQGVEEKTGLNPEGESVPSTDLTSEVPKETREVPKETKEIPVEEISKIGTEILTPGIEPKPEVKTEETTLLSSEKKKPVNTESENTEPEPKPLLLEPEKTESSTLITDPNVSEPKMSILTYINMETVSKITSIEMNQHIQFAPIAAKFGDTAGYLEGTIEFNKNTSSIHSYYWGEDKKILKLLETEDHLYSDDTVFTDMTTQVLKDSTERDPEKITDELNEVYLLYKLDPKCSKRGHGIGMKSALYKIENLQGGDWTKNTFEERSAGCGVAMRAMPIGVKYQDDFVFAAQVAMTSGYITHTSPTGFLGGVASALFSAYACRDIGFTLWPTLALSTMSNEEFKKEANELAHNICVPGNEEGEKFTKAWSDFEHVWNLYMKLRSEKESENFPDTPEGRDHLYYQLAFVKGKPYPGQKETPQRDYEGLGFLWGWPGSSGHDAPLMAYDMLMLTIKKFLREHDLLEEHPIETWNPSKFNSAFQQVTQQEKERVFEDLVERACLHGGDSDSTGVIAFYLFALIVGEDAVPERYRKNLEPSIDWLSIKGKDEG